MKKVSKKRAALLLQHAKFLKKMGLTEKTVCKSKPSNMPAFLKEGVAESYHAELTNEINGHKGLGSRKGILSDIMGYTEADRAIARQMAKQVSVEYNKGGLQYISRDTDLTKMGKKV